ncbi:outer membrane lipoprotein chaperone LolA [Neisseria sp. Ec49-e6-T10]|uniref:outer membrane lipoprotein chaperone LolA n=1 Tax=Neisseria sp. Ec49-e6-T10 TaxID=3140744 RepID=UPI003EBF951C
MKKTILILTTFLGLNMAHADGLEALKNFNQNAKTISGSFSQTVQNKNKTQKSSGTFQISRPNLFKWDYSKPYQQVIVGDGKSVWLYDIDLAQVTKRSQAQTLGDSPAAILADQDALEDNYTLSNDGQSNGITYIKAMPKKKDSGYESIRLGFKGNDLNQMVLKDSFGNTTTLTLNGIKLNGTINKKVFQFTPPKNVDVLTE